MAGICNFITRTTLAIITFILTILSIVIAGAGIYLSLNYSDYFPELHNTDPSLGNISIGIIVYGIVCAVLGTIGCIGACTGNTVLLNIYFTSLLISCIVEAGIVAYGYGDKDNVNYKVGVTFNEMFEKFNAGKGSVVDVIAVHRVQASLLCCGISGAEYWSNRTMFGVDKVPGSCCWGYDINEDVRREEGKGKWIKDVKHTVTVNETEQFSNGTSGKSVSYEVELEDFGSTCEKIDAHDVGCGEKSDELIDNFMLGIALLLLLCVGFQTVCMILTCCSQNSKIVYKERKEESLQGSQSGSGSVYPGSPMAMRGASPIQYKERRYSEGPLKGLSERECKQSFSSYPESRQSSYRGTYL